MKVSEEVSKCMQILSILSVIVSERGAETEVHDYHIIMSLCAPLRNHQQTVGRLFAGSGANCAARWTTGHRLSVLTGQPDRQTDRQMDGCDGKQTAKYRPADDSRPALIDSPSNDLPISIISRN